MTGLSRRSMLVVATSLVAAGKARAQCQVGGGSTPSYEDASLQPVKDPALLGPWWQRPMAVYQPYKVKVVRREEVDGFVFLDFELAGGQAQTSPLPSFRVELTRQGLYVWSDLPSTAQLATDDAPYGYLFLSDAWAADHGVDACLYAEGGGKYPLAAGANLVDEERNAPASTEA